MNNSFLGDETLKKKELYQQDLTASSHFLSVIPDHINL